MVVLLVYAVGRAVIEPFCLDTAFQPSAVAGSDRTQRPVEVATGETGPVDYSGILENNLFGTTGTPADPDAPQGADAMRSAEELGLKLVGFVAGSPAISRAVIESAQTHSAQPYKIGDTVASATVEAIESDRVILRYAGQRHVLVLRAAAGNDVEQHSVAAEVNSMGADTAQMLQAGAEPAQQPSDRLGYVESIFRNATIEPQVEKGQTEGLKITGLDQTPLAATFGLRDGDIVRAVNGQFLTSKQKAFQVLMKARSQPKLDIELVRNGKTKNLTFDL